MKKFRAMHVNSSWAMGGTERMLTHLIPNFDQERFESCLVCFNSPSMLTAEWEQAGIQVHHLNIDQPVSLRGVIRFLQFVRTWKPDILYVYGLRANLMARAAKLFYRVPVFITSQQGIEDWKGRLAVFLEKSTSFCVDQYIGVSKACCEMLAKREKISRKKLKVVYNGVNLNVPNDVHVRAERLKREYNIPKDAFVVGTVGRLLPVKGHEYLIDAAREATKRYPNLFFAVVGQDFRDGTLQQQAQKEGLANRFLFTGYSKIDVSSWLAAFDLFVLPSLSEGLPTVVLEALFMQCPVIATNVGGTAEIIEHEKTGLLVPAADSVSLACAIIRMYESPNLCDKFRSEGLKRAREEFSVENMVKGYENAALAIYNYKNRRLRHETGKLSVK